MPKKAVPSSKRITLEIPADLYQRLEALAEAERRELKPQLLMIIERAVKMHEGKQRSTETRKMVNRLFSPD
jgi:predicted transcriptional regulator